MRSLPSGSRRLPAPGCGMKRGGWRAGGKARHRCRAHAPCIAAPHAPCRCDVRSPCCGCEDNGSGTPRARTPAEAASAWLRAGPLFELTPALKGAAKVHWQRSSRRTGQRGLTAGLPPPRAGLPATFTPPVGQRNEPSLRFGLLAFVPSAPAGHKVCSRLRPLHGLFKCFRPGRGEYSHALEPVKGTSRSARWLRHP